MPRCIAALIRHGDYRQLPDTPSAYQPFPLTETGKQQASQAAALILEQGLQLDCAINPIIASSALLRAWQTAALIAENLDEFQANIQQHEDLAERCVGSAANLSVKQIADIVRQDPRYPNLPNDWKFNSHYRLPFPGAESLLQAGERVASVLKREMQRLRQCTQANQIKLFVGHGAAFRHAAYHLGILEYEQIARLSMHHCRPVLIELNDDGSWSHVAGDWKTRYLPDSFTD